MTKIFIQPSLERAEAINKNLNERGQKEAEAHAEKMKNHKPFKAYKTKAELKTEQASIDQDVKAKADKPRVNRDIGGPVLNRGKLK